MTRIKLCGLTRHCDIEAVNEICPEYIGFIFAKKSRRYVPPEKARELKSDLNKDILAVGVFVNEDIDLITKLLNEGIIDIAQLHGSEDEDYIKTLKTIGKKPVIKAFCIQSEQDIKAAQNSPSDYVLLDSGPGGTGEAFDWNLAKKLERPYFLAGGLGLNNAADAARLLKPYAVDISSGIETNGLKDKNKMREFARIIREKE